MIKVSALMTRASSVDNFTGEAGIGPNINFKKKAIMAYPKWVMESNQSAVRCVVKIVY
jgi:hypothetical protein